MALLCRWALKCLLWLHPPDPGGAASSRHQVSLSRLTSCRAVSLATDMVLILDLVLVLILDLLLILLLVLVLALVPVLSSGGDSVWRCRVAVEMET